jgi:hypothetical protein
MVQGAMPGGKGDGNEGGNGWPNTPSRGTGRASTSSPSIAQHSTATQGPEALYLTPTEAGSEGQAPPT